MENPSFREGRTATLSWLLHPHAPDHTRAKFTSTSPQTPSPDPPQDPQQQRAGVIKTLGENPPQAEFAKEGMKTGFEAAKLSPKLKASQSRIWR